MASVIMTLMILIWVFVIFVLRLAEKNGRAANKNAGRGLSKENRSWHTEKIPGTANVKKAPRSTDGHILTGIQDITCRQFGHNHPEWEEPTTRYIVHDDIEDGFIILNGKKMHRTEADKYEDTI